MNSSLAFLIHSRRFHSRRRGDKTPAERPSFPRVSLSTMSEKCSELYGAARANGEESLRVKERLSVDLAHTHTPRRYTERRGR